MDAPIISVRGVVKEFRRPQKKSGFLGELRTVFSPSYSVVKAVEGLSFEIQEGELVGYIGPNGAGKSTTIKMLTGILMPTSGIIEVGGLVPWRQREDNALQIGVVFGQRSALWWDLPVLDSFELIATMYGMPRQRYLDKLAHLTELLDMKAFLNTPVRQLSLGQRMRADLAGALLYEPRILYLDEPTVGLDVVAKEQILTFLEELNYTSRTTIVLTTHDLDDVERLCRRIILIDSGKVLYDGTVPGLKRRYGACREMVVQLAPRSSAGRIELNIPGVELVGRLDGKLSIRFDPEKVLVSDIITDLSARYEVIDLTIQGQELESIVRKIYTQRGLVG
jgi:ABC-2 type transport system ATP-binding protein